VNREKVLPLPIEGRIRRDSLVKEAAVFGVGKTVPGVIIAKDGQAKSLSDEDFFKAVHPSLEAANAAAESFSRIPHELVVVMSADTVFPRTEKGTIIRAALYQDFAAIIDAAYDDVDLIYHVLNPARFDWAKDLLPALKKSKLPSFEPVPPREWLQRLREGEQDPERNPSVKLIDFWERKYGQAAPKAVESEGGGEREVSEQVVKKELTFETQRTLQHAPLLGSEGDLIAAGYMEKVVERWMEKWNASP
jgi:hypothetical protein